MIVLATPKPRPHEMFLLAASILLGVSYLVRVPAPASLEASVPRWVVLVWAAALAVSGIVGLAGCLWRGELTVGLGLERGALVMSTAALLVIAGASLLVNGHRAVFSLGIMLAWGLANIYRCVQIAADLRQLAAAREEHADG